MINCEETNKEEYISAKKSHSLQENPLNLNSNCFLKISNLNINKDIKFIKEIFTNKYSICENGIIFKRNKIGNSLGEAIIVFNNDQEMERTFKELNGKQIHKEYIYFLFKF